MTNSGPLSTRASLEAARVALERMMGAPPDAGAPRTLPVTMASRASEAWKQTERLLQSLTGKPELSGQALLAEARSRNTLDMEGMHAMVAMREWVERTLAPGSAAQMLTLPPTEAEREVAGNTLAALERATGATPSSFASGASAEVASPFAPGGVSAEERSPFAPPASASAGGAASNFASAVPSQPPNNTRSQWAPQAVGNSNVAVPRSSINAAVAEQLPPAYEVNAANKPRVGSGLIMTALLVVVLLGGGGAWYYLKGRSAASDNTEQGVAAYSRGSREAARLAFTRAVQENANDVRALIYLGRISRELGDLATARRYLEDAIRVDPKNPLALRELAAALLADNQPELARRFYVRTLEVNPNDKTAQGFLGCALLHLHRSDEGMRWMQRAGTGDWSSCTEPPDALPPTGK